VLTVTEVCERLRRSFRLPPTVREKAGCSVEASIELSSEEGWSEKIVGR
jgi:hypothetical protein